MPLPFEVRELLADLTPKSAKRFVRMLESPTPAYESLSAQQKVYVQTYAETLSEKQARAEAGYVSGNHGAAVEEAVNELLAKREVESELSGEYVRQYIKDILECAPGEYFTPAVGGGWLIDFESYQDLPRSIKRLIENVQFVKYNGATFMQVMFISKTAALAMAAKYTMAMKSKEDEDSVGRVLPWDRIVKDLEESAEDTVEARILQLPACANG